MAVSKAVEAIQNQSYSNTPPHPFKIWSWLTRTPRFCSWLAENANVRHGWQTTHRSKSGQEGVSILFFYFLSSFICPPLSVCLSLSLLFSVSLFFLFFWIPFLQITSCHYHKIPQLSKTLAKYAIFPKLSMPQKRHLKLPNFIKIKITLKKKIIWTLVMLPQPAKKKNIYIFTQLYTDESHQDDRLKERKTYV